MFDRGGHERVSHFVCKFPHKMSLLTFPCPFVPVNFYTKWKCVRHCVSKCPYKMALLTVRCALVVFRMCARICISCHMCVLVCVLWDACPPMSAFFCFSHMCALIRVFLYVMCALIRVFLYVCSNMRVLICFCSHMCVLTCVLSNVCSHTCAVNMRAFPFVLSVLCFFFFF